MKSLTLKTLLALKTKGDYEIRAIAKEELAKRYGFVVLEIIEDVIHTEKEEELKLKLKILDQIKTLKLEDVSALKKEIMVAMREPKLNMESIMELYRSGNEMLLKKSKEYTVEMFSKYIYSLMNTYHKTYVEKYGEELFQCGVIGILNAMKNYHEDEGAFTTYSKLFIRHEMMTHINFLNNGISVHYTKLHNQIRNAISTLKEEEHEVTVKNIAILTDIKPDIIKREMEYMENTRFVYLDDEDVTEQVSEYSESPEAIAIQKEQYSTLTESMEHLDSITRSVIYMKYCLGHTNDRIAKENGITVRQVKILCQRGLKKLKEDPCMKRVYADRLSEKDRMMLRFITPVREKVISADDLIDHQLVVFEELFDEKQKDRKKGLDGLCNMDESELHMIIF